MTVRQQKIAVCWYHPHQWHRLKEISEDRDQLQDTYAEWKKDTNQTIKHLRMTGLIVKKVPVDLDQFLTWCNLRGFAVNGEARSEYVALMAQQEDEQS